jgi:succinate dehydrogenase/fumarate reductase flavoprotein subunit
MSKNKPQAASEAPASANDFSRRQFAIHSLSLLAGTIALTTTGLSGCSPSSSDASTGATDYVSTGGSRIIDTTVFKWDKEIDILIIGGGGAGACAALMAKINGSEPLILEKAAFTGGCTAICGQAIAAGGTTVQKELGIEDTEKDYTDFLLAVSDGDSKLIEVIGAGSLDTYNWLTELGMVTPAVEGVPGITFGGSHLVKPYVPRTHWTEGIWPVLQDSLIREGIETLLSTPAIALITDVYSGEVVGAVAGSEEKPVLIKARKAVILTAGGFTNNEEMVHEHITTGKFVSFASKTDDGDGIHLGESVGAGVSYLNSGNDASAYFDPPGACVYLIESFPVPNDPPFIAVNNKAKRFVDESDFQVPVNRGVLAQPGNMCWVISCGEDGLKGFGLSGSAEMPTSLTQSDSIEGLAQAIGLDAITLADTINAWNTACAAGVDTAFGRERCLKPIDAAPFGAAEVYPGFSSTLSGITVNTNMQAISSLTRQPIGRLFAAGANSNTLGRVYACCGSGIGGALTTGRLAGINAVKLEPWS